MLGFDVFFDCLVKLGQLLNEGYLLLSCQDTAQESSNEPDFVAFFVHCLKN
jgi:hypothetical protein